MALQALTAHAAQFVTTIVAGEERSLPDSAFTVLPPEPVRVGTLPAVAVGYSRSSANSTPGAEGRWVFALDGKRLYWFTLVLDGSLPAAEIEAATALFQALAAALPVPP